MLPENETVTFEDRLYVNPETSLNEQLGFIDQLRNVQAQNNQQIKDQTYNLGTAVPSNLGGLIGGEGYFTSRYQVPQTVALTNDLRAAAQASALNQALQNEQAKWKQRYNKAYRSARRRAGSGGSGSGYDTIEGGLDLTPTDGGIKVSDDDVKGVSAPRAGVSDTSYYQDGHLVTEYSDGSKYIDGKKVRGSYSEQNNARLSEAGRKIATQLAFMTPSQQRAAVASGAIQKYMATYGKTGGGW